MKLKATQMYLFYLAITSEVNLQVMWPVFPYVLSTSKVNIFVRDSGYFRRI